MKHHSDLISEISDLENSEELFEMANLFSKHTGLPFVVWISYKGGAKHDIRVKVSPGPKALRSEMVSVAIRPNVHVVEGQTSAGDLALLTKWVTLNHEALVKYWDGEIDTKDALDAIQSIG